MNSGLSPANPVIVSAFRSALMHQWAVVALIFALLLAAWGAARARLGGRGLAPPAPGDRGAEPSARGLLRVGFGVLWLFDGILQAQPQMAGGLPARVVWPAAASSPGWVRQLVNWGGTVWSYHPVQAAAAAVWIQAGLGMWLIFGVRGWPSRLAGAASAVWGLVVWVFGEAFGSVFAPGLTVLFGAPGAACCYVAAGLLLALPERAWRTARTGRLMLAGMGVFFLGMALLQAWPGRGFWHGQADGRPGTLTAMVQSMAGTAQPRPLSAVLSAFGRFTAAHGFAVNLVAVAGFAGLGAVFTAAAARGDARLARAGVIAGAVFCAADWALVQDFGFLGGLGTDPNSMIPLILLFTAGYQALAPAPSPRVPAPEPRPSSAAPARLGPRLTALRQGFAALSARSVAAFGAIAVIGVGAAPMALASVNRNADPIIAQALTGASAPLNTPAPGFTLSSQAGRQVSLASLRGKVVLLTFLDPVSGTDCPIIAQELRAADMLLGGRARDAELVAVVASRVPAAPAATAAFTRREGLSPLPNWLYLTGSLSQLEAVWRRYRIEVADPQAGSAARHDDRAYVISAAGRIRQSFSDDPGPGTATTRSSFAGLLAGAVLRVMG